MEEIVDMSEALEEVLDMVPSRGRHSWTKLECLRVEKGLLVHGWAQWREILRAARFRKRTLGLIDVENIARTMVRLPLVTNYPWLTSCTCLHANISEYYYYLYTYMYMYISWLYRYYDTVCI